MKHKKWAGIILLILIILLGISFGVSYLIIKLFSLVQTFFIGTGWSDEENLEYIQYSIEIFNASEGHFPDNLEELQKKYPFMEDNIKDIEYKRIRYSPDEKKGYILRFCGEDNILDTDDDAIYDHFQYKTLQTQRKNYYQSIPSHYLLYGRIWEFHPDYIQITDFGNILDDYPVTTIRLSSMDLYSFQDLSDVNYSKNIRAFENETVKIEWRDEIYDEISFSLYPEEIIPSNESFFFTLSYKVDRIPHLHTQEKISPDKELHLGINSGPTAGLRMNERYQIIAVPKSAEVIEVFQHLPTRTEEIGEWRVYFYDISNIDGRVSMHIKFKLTDEDVAPLEVDKVLETAI